MRATIVVAVVLTLAGLGRAELQLQKVRPEKIYCKPGQAVSMEVVVANPGAEAASAKLVVELVHDVSAAVKLAEKDITVEPGKTLVWQDAWQGQAWLGVELRATLLRDGKQLARKSDYFTCAPSVHQVLMWGRGNHGGMQFPGTIDATADKYAAEFSQQWRSQYGNFFDQFGWGPSDFDCLTPKEDRWWAGQTSYNESRTNTNKVYDAFRAQGIQSVTYGKAAGGGPVTYENLRRRPEMAGYTDGRPWLENYSAAYLDFMETLGPPKPGEKRMVPGTPEEMKKAGYKGTGWFAPYTKGGCNWCSVWYPCTRDEVLDVGINELIGSAKMFGYNGVRFDGEFAASRCRTLDGTFVADEKFDEEAANTRLVRRMKETIWKACPGYLFGYNAGTQIHWSVGADNTPASFREKCKDDGLIANEALAFPGNVTWMEYAGLIRREAEIVRHYGGHHATYPFDRAGNRPYNFFVNLALRSHMMGWYQGPAFEAADFNRFGARFASLLWDAGLRTWAEADKNVAVKSARPLWWQPFAAVRPATGGGTQFIIHLINPPEGKTVAAKAKEALPAEPARDVTVLLKEPKGFRRAVLVTFPSCDVRPLEPSRQDGQLVFAVAEVPYWAMLVVEADCPTPEAQYEKAVDSPKAATPSAEDLQLAPKTDAGGADGKPAWRDVLEPENWGGGETTAERVKDPDAHGGGAVRGKPDRPPGGMANTYSYPRIPGSYRATFRLKVADNTLDKPVFRICVGDWVMHPLPGVPAIHNPTLEIKATDFKKPNVYQDFTVPFEHADMGFVGVGCHYVGNVEASWDRAVAELVEPWSPQRLQEHYKGMAPPAGLQLQRDAKLDVLVIRGLWNRLYRIDEALAPLGDKAAVSSAYTTFHQQQDTQLSGFKLDWQPLFTQDVIVLANVETRGLGLGQVRMIGEFVRQGGGLVILGGLTTLGQAGNMQRGWGEFLPVELNIPWEIRKCEPPVTFALPAKDSPLADVKWEIPPTVFYRHVVKAKPGATVLLAGDHGEPLLVGATCGKGRVAVFTGTVLGQPAKGQAAFWDTDAWKAIVSRAVTWAAGK
jgi:hypothetical protein